MLPQVVATWGARAIFQRGNIDILHDRQSWTVPNAEEDQSRRKQLQQWINSTGMPWLCERVKSVNPSGTEIVNFDDGQFHIEASPQSSCGYLYIRAWERKLTQGDCGFFIQQPTPTDRKNNNGHDIYIDEYGNELMWSGQKFPGLPEVGTMVDLDGNSIGKSKVKGYFCEAGYLGVMLKPTRPPKSFRVDVRKAIKDPKSPQWIKEGLACAFGAEIRPWLKRKK